MGDPSVVQLPGGITWPALVEVAPLPVSVVDMDGRQIYGNAAYAAFLGYDPSELAGLDVARITLPSDRAWTAAYLRRLRALELDRFTTAKRFVRKDGTTVTGVLTITPIIDAGACVALAATITPVDRNAPLAEGVVRKLIENISDTITLLDADGRLLETSGRYTPILGYPREFWAERSLFDLVLADDLPEVARLQQEVMASPGELITGEVRVRDAEGLAQVLDVSAVNLLDDADVGGIVVTTRNITRVRHLIEELSARRDEALAEAELRSRLVATVSHELRNPLHAVLGLSELVAAAGTDAASRAEMASVLNRQLRDLARIVDDLLTASRLEAGAVTIEHEPVVLRTVVDDVVAVHADRAPEGVVVHGAVEPGAPSAVVTDPVRLRQILGNLVGNAVKFTTDGLVELRVGFAGGQLQATVRDTGVGIPAAELGRVFEPFVIGSTASGGAGAGLGLTIVRRLVEALGGDVSVASVLGSGTTFTVRLPVEEASPVGASVAPVSALGSLHVLVVDDNLVNQQLAAAQLKALGHCSTVVGTGQEALELLADPQTPPVDIVLMDVHLPGIDGVEATGLLRELEQRMGLPRTPVVGVTASSVIADADAARAVGMDDHLPKPVRLADLEACLSRLVGGAEGRTDAVQPTGREPSVVQQPVAAIVDVTALDTLAEEIGDREVIEQMVATYRSELSRRVDGIVAAGAAGDQQRHGLLVHTLASSSRLLGAGRLAELAELYPGLVDEHTLRSAAEQVSNELAGWVSL